MTRTLTIRVDQGTYDHIQDLAKRNGKATIEGMAARILDGSRKYFERMEQRYEEMRTRPQTDMSKMVVPLSSRRRPHEHDCGEPDCQPLKLGDGVTK